MCLCALVASPALSQQRAASSQTGADVRMTGRVRDEINGITLPGVPVEAVSSGAVVYTDVDGRFILHVPQGPQRIKVALDGTRKGQSAFRRPRIGP